MLKLPRVEVRVYATFREFFPSNTLRISIEAQDVGELIDFLTEAYSSGFRERLLDQETGRLRPYNKILVNGRDIDFLNYLKTKLRDGDSIVFFPPAGGGDRKDSGNRPNQTSKLISSWKMKNTR